MTSGARLNDFQRTCLEGLLLRLADAGVPSPGHRVVEGKTEVYMHGSVGPIEFWIYEDGACFTHGHQQNAAEKQWIYEPQDYETVSALGADFIDDLLRVAQGSLRPVVQREKSVLLGYVYDLLIVLAAYWLVVSKFDLKAFGVFVMLNLAGLAFFDSRLSSRRQAVSRRWLIVFTFGCLAAVFLWPFFLGLKPGQAALAIASVAVLVAARMLMLPARSEPPV